MIISRAKEATDLVIPNFALFFFCFSIQVKINAFHGKKHAELS